MVRRRSLLLLVLFNAARLFPGGDIWRRNRWYYRGAGMRDWDDLASDVETARENLAHTIEAEETKVNVQAFLNTIAVAEIGYPLMEVSDDGYNVLVGSTASHPLLFHDYSKHPLADPPSPINLGGGLWSTAAGRYQFLARYWDYYRDLLSLPDFSPDSQDNWAVQLIREQDALKDVQQGRIEIAVSKCNNVWASFPGNGYNQPQRNMGELLQVFTAEKGKLV